MSELTQVNDAPGGDRWMVMVQQFMQRPDASIEMLERLLALRDKEMRDRATAEFKAAFARCQAKVTKAEKDKDNPMFHSRYASLEAMYDAVWPAVMHEGFGWTVSALTQAPEGWAGEPVIWFQGRLSKGIVSDAVELPVSRSALTPQGPQGGRAAMTPTQALGALTTYMRKYLLGLMFGVVTADDIAADNDGNRGGGSPDRQQPPPKSTQESHRKPQRTPDITEGAAQWLVKLVERIEAAPTGEDLDKIEAREDVSEALEKAPLRVRNDIRHALDQARKRVAEAEDAAEGELEPEPPRDAPDDPVGELIAEIDTLDFVALRDLEASAEWRARVKDATHDLPPERERIAEAITARRAFLRAGAG